MKVPFLDLKAQYATIRDELRSAVDEVLESQRFILGPQVAALEQDVARFCHVPYAVGVASGTDALLLSLKALGVGQGDGVVTVPFTFFATAGAIANLGARPIFVDIEDASFTMDPKALELLLEQGCSAGPLSRRAHLQSRATVKAVIVVQLFGQCADMDAVLRIAGRHSIPVVEDSCQAIGARFRDKPAGSMGALGCFSFFPSKNLGGAGDGGMVVSGDKDLSDRVRLLRTHGAQPQYFHKIVGFNSRLDEIQAAILRVKLRHLERWSKARQKIAGEYKRKFQAADLLDRIALPEVLPNRVHVFHQFVIRCQRRDELRSFLSERGIETEIYYPVPLHEQECFRYLGYQPSDFPQAHAASRQALALPIYPELTGEQIDCIVSTIAELLAG